MTSETTATRPRILFVDDEPRILVALKALFRNHYHVTTANSGAAAVEILREQEVDVIVSDQRMPQMNGVEFLRTAKSLRPRAIRVLLTGYSDLNAILGAINEGEIFRYINKPWSNADLRETIAAAADAAKTEGSEAELIELQRDAVDPEASDAPSEAVPERPPEGVASSPVAPVRPVTPITASLRDDVGILVLDDDQASRDVLQRVLSNERNVHTAKTLEEALEILENHKIGVLITELIVDGETVTHLLTALRQHHPALVAIVLSAQADAGHGIELINRGQIYRFLSKPVGEGLLRGSVNLAVRRYEILDKNPNQTRRFTAEVAPPPSKESDRRGVFSRIGRLFGLTA